MRATKSTKTRPVTASYLRNAALHYLSARAASTAMVRQTLERRAKRRLGVRRLSDETHALIEAAVAELVERGLLCDATYAAARARSLTAKGLSRRRVTDGLRSKGIAGDDAAHALDPGFDELAQARRFAERKRLGVWRRGDASATTRDKDLRALARAGFAFAIASKALEGDDG